MTRPFFVRTAWVLAAAGLAAKADAQDDLWFRIESSAATVACGEAFEVRVTVGARDGLAPEPIDPTALRPLRLRVVGTSSELRDGFAVETVTYEARAAVAGAVVVEAPFARARTADGGTVVAFADDLVLDVRDVLPNGDDGALELPVQPWQRPFAVRRALPAWGSVLLVALGASWFTRRQLRAAAARRALAVESPVAVARRCLDELRSRIGDADSRQFAADLGNALLTFVARQAGRPELLVSAREEILRHPTFCALPGADDLASILEELDAAKFAGAALDQEQRLRLCAVFEARVAAEEESV